MLAAVLAIALLLPLASARGQGSCAEGWLPGQGVPGVIGTVEALAVLPGGGGGGGEGGGEVMVAGGFRTAGGLLAENIARYNLDTGMWSVPERGTNHSINALVVLPDGDVIVGGHFTFAGGVAANGIARYNPTTDVWSALGSGVTGENPSIVYALAVLPSGDVIVGGRFSMAGGVAASNIARYNPRSGVWSALGSGITSGRDVFALAVLPGGDVIVGGWFNTAGGQSANNIARYTPAGGGVWTALGSGTHGTVNALAVLPGGDVIVGGDITFAGNVAANRIARFNPNTRVWSALGSGTSSTVNALAVLPGGDFIVAGDFTSAGGVAANRLARYKPSSGVWSAVGSGTNSTVSAIAVLPGGDLIVGGGFSVAGGVGVSSIAKYNPASDVWSALGSGINSNVMALAVLPGGDAIVGGWFTTTSGVGASRIARYNPNSGVWSALGSGTDGSVSALAVVPVGAGGGVGGDVIVGGTFTMAGGVAASNIARFNPTTGVWSALGGGTNGAVRALMVLSDGDVIVGGSFTTAGGVAASNIARYNLATGVWSALGSGVDRRVLAFAVLPGVGGAGDGDLIAGGEFTTAGGEAASRIARVNLTTGVWSALDSGVDGAVHALAVLPTGKVIMGGSFNTAGGTQAGRIVEYTPSTRFWSAIGNGTSNDVYALAVLPGGDVIAGGAFTTVGFGGLMASGIARINPTTGIWVPLGRGTGTVRSLAVLPGGEGDVIVGGGFARSGGNVSAYFARYTFGNQLCPADFNCIAGPTTADIFEYLNAWFASDPRAEFDGIAGIDAADLVAFFNAWFAGC